MSATEFAEVTGLSYRSVMNYLNEGRDPSVEALIKIHNGLGVSITWLLTGNGTVFQIEHKESDISEQEKDLITYYRTMPMNLKDAFDVSFGIIAQKINSHYNAFSEK